jgi:hypothetical protein
MFARILSAILVIAFASPVWCGIINFEGFTDSEALTNQVLGLTFTHTTVLTAGVSLNQFDFPPHSGTNVAFDDGGPITIAFSHPIEGFLGYFTYITPLSLIGFNAANSEVASDFSRFSNNTGTGGDPGSSPNELLEIIAPGGISQVSITGDGGGSSFTMDDIQTTVPEPNIIALLTAVLAGLGYQRRRRA